MKRYTDLVAECLAGVTELFPWDLADRLAQPNPPLLVDIREPYEYAAMHIAGSINVPRGIIESACEWDYEETVPALVEARQQELILICRSGNRSVLAASTLQRMGYQQVKSLKTGIRGWNDFEQPLINSAGEPVDIDDADAYFTTRLRPEQHRPT